MRPKKIKWLRNLIVSMIVSAIVLILNHRSDEYLLFFLIALFGFTSSNLIDLLSYKLRLKKWSKEQHFMQTNADLRIIELEDKIWKEKEELN